MNALTVAVLTVPVTLLMAAAALFGLLLVAMSVPTLWDAVPDDELVDAFDEEVSR